MPRPLNLFFENVPRDAHLQKFHRHMGVTYLVETQDIPKPLDGQKLKWISLKNVAQEEIIEPVKKLAIQAWKEFQKTKKLPRGFRV